jgi:peptidyl-prolyl cis-trans isomerase SurA
LITAAVGIALGLGACADTGGLFGKKAAPVVAADTTAATNAPLVKPTSNSSIPVLVNDVPITNYDIDQRLRLDRLGGTKTATVKSATEELIDETVESIEAQRRGVGAPDAQVDGAFATIASHLKMTPDAFTKALASQGIDAKSLKKRLAAQMIWQQLVQQRTQSKAQITAADISAAVAKQGDPNNLKITEFTLQQIIFVVPPGSSAGLYAQRRDEAQAFRQRFAGCDHSLDQAKQLRGVVVKDLGRHESTEMNDPTGQAVQKTPVGHAAPPTQMAEGIELIAVCATREIDSTSGAVSAAQNNLYLQQSADLGKDYLKELRDHAIIEYR